MKDQLLITIPFDADYQDGRAFDNLKAAVDSITAQTSGYITTHIAEGTAGRPKADKFCHENGLYHSHHPSKNFDANILRNAGPAAHPDIEWLLWIDQDMVLHPQYAELLLGHLRWLYEGSNPLHVLIGSVRINGEATPQAFTSEEVIRSIKQSAWYMLSGHNVLTHRSTYELVGEWDESLNEFGAEDIEFSYRAASLGVMTLQVNKAFCHHMEVGHFDLGISSDNERLDSDIWPQLIRNWSKIYQKYGLPRVSLRSELGYAPQSRMPETPCDQDAEAPPAYIYRNHKFYEQTIENLNTISVLCADCHVRGIAYEVMKKHLDIALMPEVDYTLGAEHVLGNLVSSVLGEINQDPDKVQELKDLVLKLKVDHPELRYTKNIIKLIERVPG